MSHAVTGTDKQKPTASSGDKQPSVFAFTNYREYLKAVLAYNKAKRKSFSLATFAQSLGFSTHAGLAMVLSGQRELRNPYLEKCIRKLKLDARERIYFESMVRASQLTEKTRTRFLRQVELLTTRWDVPHGADTQRLIDYLLVQQILCLYRPIPMSCDAIAKHFRYQITSEQIHQSLLWLKNQGLVDTRDGRTWFPLKSVFMLKDEIPNEEGRQLHKDFMRLAALAMDNDPIESREFQTYVISVNRKRIPELKQWIKRAAVEIASEFEEEMDADTLVQFHFNLFEVINKVERGG